MWATFGSDLKLDDDAEPFAHVEIDSVAPGHSSDIDIDDLYAPFYSAVARHPRWSFDDDEVRSDSEVGDNISENRNAAPRRNSLKILLDPFLHKLQAFRTRDPAQHALAIVETRMRAKNWNRSMRMRANLLQ